MESSRKRLSDFGECDVAGNGLNPTGANIIATLQSLNGPKATNNAIFGRIQTFNQSVSQECPSLAREAKGFFRNLLNGKCVHKK